VTVTLSAVSEPGRRIRAMSMYPVPRHVGTNEFAVKTSTPVSVTSTVCSNCAERAKSAVTAVHPSLQGIRSG
jgi:hypothetical protein